MVDCNMHEEKEADLDDLMDDAAIDAICGQCNAAFDEVYGPRVTDFEVLKTAFEEAYNDPNQREDFVANLMQKDSMIAVGIFKMANGDEAPPYLTARDHLIQLLSQSIYAGKLHTNDPALIAQFLDNRFPGVGHFESQRVVSIAKSLMI